MFKIEYAAHLIDHTLSETTQLGPVASSATRSIIVGGPSSTHYMSRFRRNPSIAKRALEGTISPEVLTCLSEITRGSSSKEKDQVVK
ncbi:hypothetical protein V6Z12_A13G045500 [Gossypium hirsutum]